MCHWLVGLIDLDNREECQECYLHLTARVRQFFISLLGLTTIEMSPSLLQLWSLRWKYLEYLLFTVFCAIILLLIVTNPGDQPLADNTLTPAEQRNMNIWIWTVGCLLICNDFRVQTCSNIDLQKSNCSEVYFVSMKAKGWYNWSLLPGIITSSHPQTL